MAFRNILSIRITYLVLGIISFIPDGQTQTWLGSKKHLTLPDTTSGTRAAFHYGHSDTLFTFTPIQPQFDTWYLDSLVFGASYMTAFRPKDEAPSQSFNLNALSFEPVQGSNVSFYDARGLVTDECAAQIDLYFIKSGTSYYLLEGPWIFQVHTKESTLFLEAEFVIDLNYQRLDSLVQLGEIPHPYYETRPGTWESYSLEEMLQSEWYAFYKERYKVSGRDLEALLNQSITASIPLSVEEHMYSDAHSGVFCGC